MPQVHELIGQCFYRGVAPSEIKEMTFPELQYWAEWSRLISKTEVDAVNSEAARRGNK